MSTHDPDRSAQLEAEVSARIDQVREAQRSALYTLESKWLQTEQVRNNAAGIRSLAGRIDSWAEAGRAGLRDPAGWNAAGWLKAGRVLLEGLDGLRDDGERSTLDDLKWTAEQVKADAVQVAKKTAKIAQKTVEATAETVGNATGAIVRPFLPLVGVAVAGLGLLVYLRGRK